jgi:hypothetical protein
VRSKTTRSKRFAFISAVVMIVTLGAFAFARAADAPIVIPLSVEHGPNGGTWLGIDVMIDSKPSNVMLSTGSTGLRILADRAGSLTRRTGRSAAGSYGSGIRLHGEEAKGTFAVGLARGGETSFEVVDSVDCLPEVPNCPAADLGVPLMFGRLFPGILGIGLMGPPPSTCCTNPLPSLAGGVGRSYVVHGNIAAPSLTLNPDSATVANFTMVPSALGWSRGCVSFTGTEPNEVCGGVLFDTGSTQMVVTTTGIARAGSVPLHTPVTLRVGTWSHLFEVGSGTAQRVVVERGNANSILVGLAYMQDFDVYYDFANAQIGLANRLPPGTVKFTPGVQY